jgi:hypothetical protein
MLYSKELTPKLGWESDAGQLQALSVQLKTSLAQTRELDVDRQSIKHGNYQATKLNDSRREKPA